MTRKLIMQRAHQLKIEKGINLAMAQRLAWAEKKQLKKLAKECLDLIDGKTGSIALPNACFIARRTWPQLRQLVE